MDMDDLKRKRIGVLMGGWSREREISLISGRMVCEALKRKGLNATAIDLKKDFLEGLTKNPMDVAFIALHGEGGEDGQIQAILEAMRVPYTGSGVLASALSLDKGYSKMIFQVTSVRTPDFCLIKKGEDPGAAEKIALEKVGIPLVLKPTKEGSSIGIVFIHSEKELKERLEPLMKEYGNLIAEEVKEGMCATTGILGCGGETRALPILELVPKAEFYDYTAKYTPGMTEFIIPARLKKSVYAETQAMGLRAHRALGCHGFSRVDVIVEKNEVPFVLEVNSIPGLTQLSDLPAEAKHEGIGYDDLVVEILKSAFIERPE